MIRVHLDNPYNSTIFTNCCDTAILGHQACCPACGEEVTPGHEATQQQRDSMRWSMAYGPCRPSTAPGKDQP